MGNNEGWSAIWYSYSYACQENIESSNEMLYKHSKDKIQVLNLYATIL